MDLQPGSDDAFGSLADPLTQTVGVEIHRLAEGCQQLICTIRRMETFVGVVEEMRNRFESKVKTQP